MAPFSDTPTTNTSARRGRALVTVSGGRFGLSTGATSFRPEQGPPGRRGDEVQASGGPAMPGRVGSACGVDEEAQVSEDGPELTRSVLHERHVALGAKFAAFGGWTMPVEYAGAGVLAEHRAVRRGAGIFDVSHLGKVSVRGAGAAGFLNRCLTNDLGKIRPGQAQYTLLCFEDGGVLDGLIVYLRSEDDLLLVPNAANCAA